MIKQYTCHIPGRLIVQILICWCSWLSLTAQNPVSKVEYFLGKDPGIGQAISVPVTYGADIDINFEINTSGLTAGMHLMGVRGYNGKGWSQTYLRLLALSPSGVTFETLEYFWDADPGVGNATRYNCQLNGNDVSIDMDILTSGLSAGIHTLGIRACSNGVWSQTYLCTMAISPSNVPLEAIEYFWDIDPGIGNAVRYDCSAEGGDVMIDFEALCDTVSPGIHLLGIRACSYGSWSHTYTRTIAVFPTGNPYEYAEYYWDIDPGKGNGISLPMTIMDGYAMVDIENIPTDTLSTGEHTLIIRAQAMGVWSLPHIKTIYINGKPNFSISKDTICANEVLTITNLTTGVIEGTRYEWDMNGDGITDSTESDTFTYSYKEPGEYEITLRAIADNSLTTCTKTVVVLSIDNPTVNLTASKITFCPGDKLVFRAVVENAGLVPDYEWYINNELVASDQDTLLVESPRDGDNVMVKVISSAICSNVSEVNSEVIILREDVFPEAYLAHYFPVYTSEDTYPLSGGLPEGGIYYINNNEATNFDPKLYPTGSYDVTYRYANSSGCDAAATRTFELKVPGSNSLLLGDVNKDEMVDIYDVLCDVDLVYNTIYPTHTLVTADINNDGQINVSDVVGIAGIILNKDGDPLRNKTSKISSINTSNVLRADKVIATPGSVISTSISINCNAWISGAQFDISLPDGVSLTSGSPNVTVGRLSDTDNIYRVLSYTMSLDRLAELPLHIIISEDVLEGDYPLTFESTVLSDRNMINVLTGTEEGLLRISRSATNIETGKEGVIVMADNSHIMIQGAEGYDVMLYDMSGRMIDIRSGIRSIERIMVPAIGTYIVRLVADGLSDDYKVIVK